MAETVGLHLHIEDNAALRRPQDYVPTGRVLGMRVDNLPLLTLHDRPADPVAAWRSFQAPTRLAVGVYEAYRAVFTTPPGDDDEFNCHWLAYCAMGWPITPALFDQGNELPPSPYDIAVPNPAQLRPWGVHSTITPGGGYSHSGITLPAPGRALDIDGYRESMYVSSVLTRLKEYAGLAPTALRAVFAPSPVVLEHS